MILSGGPNSVYDDDVPGVDAGLLTSGIPLLGICYGMQLIAQMEGAPVLHGHREYGRAELTVTSGEGLFAGFECGSTTTVWCSHGDHVDDPPAGVRAVRLHGDASDGRVPGRRNERSTECSSTRRWRTPTSGGRDPVELPFRHCGLPSDMDSGGVRRRHRPEDQGADRGRETAICGLSGGVDSSVAALLVHRAIGDRLTCIFVDHGSAPEGRARSGREHVSFALRHEARGRGRV